MWQALKIEEMRIQLSVLAVAKNFDMQDPDVISLSRKLDCLIVDFEKAKQRSLGKTDHKLRFSFS